MDGRAPSSGEKLPLVEHFYSLQGEGYHTGKAAYFIRIGGCDVGCSWCDSRYSWNPDLHPLVDIDEIARHVSDSGADSVVITGGEPLMWDMNPLTSLLGEMGIKLFLETSGSHSLTGRWDWICLSPKKNSPPVGDICLAAGELKVIIEVTADFDWAEEYRARVRSDCKLFLQPEWSRFDAITGDIVNYILKNPAWAISLQSHKYMRIP
ncbi:MAG: 7-carboxy-7-deazaguanine synthase QueE [Bacteroidales bacterium]|nr:7-carboxy-7-deazaguanine synthase QueE [Bacteroidales bacterium]